MICAPTPWAPGPMSTSCPSQMFLRCRTSTAPSSPGCRRVTATYDREVSFIAMPSRPQFARYGCARPVATTGVDPGLQTWKAGEPGANGQYVVLRRSSPRCYMLIVSGTAEPAKFVASSTSTDEYLFRRQVGLQEEAREVLDELDLERRLDDFGSMLVTGSFISGLMVWRELDIMFLGGPELSPTDVLAAMGRLVLLPGIVRFDYADERGLRSPTGEPRDERYHVPTTYARPSGTWRLDLTFWLHDAARKCDDLAQAVARFADARGA